LSHFTPARPRQRTAHTFPPALAIGLLSTRRPVRVFSSFGVSERPNLYELTEEALAAPSVYGGSKTAQSKPGEVEVEVCRRRVSSIMHGLDRMSASEAYWHVGGLIEESCGAGRSTWEFLDAGEAEAALRILHAEVPT
jgi:hypothetical protein